MDAFASKGSHQVPRYMTWSQDSRAVAVNILDYYWYPVTWLFPLVPLIPLALEKAQQQQIGVILNKDCSLGLDVKVSNVFEGVYTPRSIAIESKAV